MAIGLNHGDLAPRPGRGLARAFVLGTKAPAHEWTTARLASLFTRAERDHREERPPVASAVAKLIVWILVGIIVTSAVAVAVGALVARIYTSAFG